MTSNTSRPKRRKRKAFPSAYDPAKLTPQMVEVINPIFKNDVPYRTPDRSLELLKKNHRRTKAPYKGLGEYTICLKCGYPFSNRGFLAHWKKCDGTGPKDTAYGANKERTEECPHCQLDMGWMAPADKSKHITTCDMNPEKDAIKHRRRVTAAYASYVTTGKIYYDHEDVYARIKKRFLEQLKMTEENADALIEELKKSYRDRTQT